MFLGLSEKEHVHCVEPWLNRPRSNLTAMDQLACLFSYFKDFYRSQETRTAVKREDRVLEALLLNYYTVVSTTLLVKKRGGIIC